MDSTKKEQLAFGCKDYVEMINTQFNNILNMLYSDTYKDKDHIPSLNAIYAVYTGNSRFDNVLFTHMTFPTFLAILIDTDIKSLDNYMRVKSPIFNTNRFYMNDFQNIELVRLYLEEIIFTFLSGSSYLGHNMLVEIFSQFKNISHGSYSYIYKYADYCIDMQSIIYDSDLFKNAHNLKSEIRLLSEDISKIILDESYKKSIERFTEYATVHHTLDKYVNTDKIDISSEKVKIEDEHASDFDKSETNEKCEEKIEHIIAPEDGFISSVDTDNKFFDVKFVRSVTVCSDTSIGAIDGMRIEYCDSKSIFKNCKIVDIKCEVPFDIVVGREFKKGDILLKQIICNETEQPNVICEPSYINPLSYKLDGTAKVPEAFF